MTPIDTIQAHVYKLYAHPWLNMVGQSAPAIRMSTSIYSVNLSLIPDRNGWHLLRCSWETNSSSSAAALASGACPSWHRRVIQCNTNGIFRCFMLRYATVIVYNEQLPKSWGDKFSKMPKISGSVCFIFWPIPKASEITSQVTWELTIFVCTFRIVFGWFISW